MNIAAHVIRKFESQAALARALGHKYPSTVQGWFERGVIPAVHMDAVLAAAKREGVRLKHADFFQPG